MIILTEPSLLWLWGYTGTILGDWLSFFTDYYLLTYPFALAFLAGLAGLIRKFFSKGG